MFVWGSNGSPVSDRPGLQVSGGSNEQAGVSDQGAKEIRMLVSDPPEAAPTNGEFGGEEESGKVKEVPNGLHKLRCNSTVELNPKEAVETGETGQGKHMPPASVMTRLILIMVWRKLIRNPNTYSSLIGLIWALVAFRLVN